MSRDQEDIAELYKRMAYSDVKIVTLSEGEVSHLHVGLKGTINGNVRRGNGILNNEMYIGKIVWNLQRFIKDPDSGRRQARSNPETEWITQEVPELRILDDDLWEVAKARQSAIKQNRPDNDASSNALHERRRPKYLFSGLTKCACCGGGYSMISVDLVGCATARNKGTCNNRRNIRRDQIETRVLNALRHHLMDPALFKEFCDEFTREMNRLRIEERTSIDASQAEMKRIERDLEKIMELYLKDAMPIEMVRESSKKLEARKSELAKFFCGGRRAATFTAPQHGRSLPNSGG